MALSDLTYVQDILKRFGIIIYTGNRIDDVVLMELELNDLFEWKLISDEEFLKSKAILSREQKTK